MRISGKICLLGTSLVGLCALAVALALIIQKKRLQTELEAMVQQQAKAEATKVLQGLYQNCESSDNRTRRRLSHNFKVARELLGRLGPCRLDADAVTWQAVNQFNKQVTSVALPRFMAGSTWLGQNAKTNIPSPAVDEVKHFTRDYATVFQRMNEQGDMIRVCTSVLNTNGTRAIGTYIPVKNPDGAENPVLKAVLKGETYQGVAYVVNEWHATQYEPIWDSAHKTIIGMLYVGVSLTDINRELRHTVLNTKSGKTGYAFVLGAKGDQQGKWIVSQEGTRDGVSVWDEKDAAGQTIYQAMLKKALESAKGKVAFEDYMAAPAGKSAGQRRFASVVHFEPFNWVLGVDTCVDDYQDVVAHAAQRLDHLFWWVITVMGGTVVLGLLASFKVAGGIAAPLQRAVDVLRANTDNTASTATQVSSNGQALAEGVGKQATALEETSATLEEMASMTRRNADNAQQVNSLARQARAAVDVGMADMQSMGTALRDIQRSSDEIAQIIKTIDEIAFQTNLLALNAAVEAARAGDAGLGFAVVADEVRNLAQRSALAAKETSAKIEGAITRTNQGVAMGDKVGRQLQEIVEHVRQVDDLVAQLVTATNEQKQGIQQVNEAVHQMDQVTQRNAANAEESASASEELNAQVQELKSVVEDLERVLGAGMKPNHGSTMHPRTAAGVFPYSQAQHMPLAARVSGSVNSRRPKQPTLIQN